MLASASDLAEGLVSQTTEVPHLFICIACQTTRCHRRALEACRDLFVRLNGEYHFTEIIWQFELLEYANMRKLALRDVTEADIVVIAAEDVQNISNGLELWFRDWSVQERDRPSAIVGLFSTPKNSEYSQNPLEKRLEEISKEQGMAFFSKTQEATNPEDI
jgi:hypothetical protein